MLVFHLTGWSRRINEVIEALKLFEVAVNALSSRGADLLVTERVIEFALKKLDGSMSDIGKN